MAHTLTDFDPDAPNSPWYWPAAPLLSVFQRHDHLGRFPVGWLAHGLPPSPWPLSTDYPKASYGPADTTWEFQGSAYNDRLDEVRGDLTDDELENVCFENGAPSTGQPESRVLTWNVPGSDPAMTINALRATIHAKVSDVEEAVNVLHYITDPEDDITPEIVDLFAAKVAAQWAAFLSSTGGNIGGGASHTVRHLYSNQVVFDEVRCAHVELVGGVAKWVGDTSFVSFDGSGITGQGSPLPSEVALVLSLGTNGRGRSRRGRTYLGPLSTDLMNADGLFQPAMCNEVVNNWVDAMATGMMADDNPFKLVVLSGATNARYLVTDARVGIVPDSQRRRRRSYSEAYSAPVSV